MRLRAPRRPGKRRGGFDRSHTNIALFSITRLHVERQRNAGARIAKLFADDAAAKRKRAESITVD